MKKHCIIKLSLIAALMLISHQAWSFSLVMNANQVLENNGGYWTDPGYTYQDDALSAWVLGTANGGRYLRVGLEDPSIDTTNIMITGVTIYAKAYSNYSKSKIRLQPYFNNVAGLESPGVNLGTSEVLRSYDITSQRAWTWQELKDLSVRVTPRTGSYFYLNHVFVVVTYTDSTILGDYSFEFSTIASPETLGYYFPVRIIVRDSLGDTAKSYNGNASISDLTGTITPINAQFISGVCNLPVMIGENTALTSITVDDGDTSAVSNGFSVVSGLHHFWISPVASPQTVGSPFPVSISACDFNGDTLTTFNGKADLVEITGALIQDSTGSFTSGVWNGNITINGGAGIYDTLWAEYTKTSHSSRGKSNAFLLASPLGLEMTGMTAEVGPKAVTVTWQTQCERGCAYWKIERSSTPETGYQEVGRVNGRGNTNAPSDYSFSDAQVPKAGSYYYRLAQVSTSGTVSYFGPVSAYWKGVTEEVPGFLRSFPNPARGGSISLDFNIGQEQKTALKVYSITGALVRTLLDQTLTVGKHSFLWDGKDQAGNKVAPGIYVIKLAGERTNITVKQVLLR
ncbi:T9SS type A sorting domain-containing protein [candidate division TA06 bacterium]|nr:T9SS type A sorting domain-containing protein [candidate division TA06 bacterium]